MSTPITPDSVLRALAAAVADTCGQRLGGAASLQPGSAPAGSGWLATVPVSGAATGHLLLWFETASAQALARIALKLDQDPSQEAVVGLISEIARAACTAMEVTPAAAGLLSGDVTITVGSVPSSAATFQITLSPELTCAVALSASISTSARTSPDLRLEAVLDVDLPLVVRFGRALMPLRTLADLGPGSVVDMGRSPDDPVELLIGERLIARGEVVVVGGNYGVRITELAGGVPASVLEARAS